MIATAGLLTYYGQIETTANVEQSVQLRNVGGSWRNWDNPIERTLSTVGGDCEIEDFEIRNQASIEAKIGIDTSITKDSIWVNPDPSVGGVNVNYYKYGYSVDATYDLYSPGVTEPIKVDIVVEEVGNWLQWTLTYSAPIQAASLNIDYPNAVTGSEICIHNNDGQDTSHAWGTWLYTNDGEQPGTGNTLVSSLTWVEATGARSTDSVYVIKIHKSAINDEFHWHVKVTPVGGPMYGTDYDGNTWGHMIDANFWQPLTTPFILQPGQVLPFRISYCFAINIMPGQYDITSKFVPAE